MCIKVLGGAKRRYASRGRHHRRVGQGSHSARPREEGRRAASHRRAHPKDIKRKDGSVIRFDTQRRGDRQQAGRADRHPHLRTGAARTARQEPHEDHLARAGGALMAAKIKKGDSVDRARRQGQGPHRQGDRGDARRTAACSWRPQHGPAPHPPVAGRPARAASSARKRRSTSRTSPSSTPSGKPTRVGFQIDGRQEGPRAKTPGEVIDG